LFVSSCQGERQCHYQQQSTSNTFIGNDQQLASVQYEITDEYGNRMPIDGIDDIIKMSGIDAREIQQTDGTIVKEYIIDDPQILSQVHTQRCASVSQTCVSRDYGPPPPPRVSRQSSAQFQPAKCLVKNLASINIQHVHILRPQQSYEYVTKSGRHVHFIITELDTDESRSDARATCTSTDRLSEHPSMQSVYTLPTRPPSNNDVTHEQQTSSVDRYPSANMSGNNRTPSLVHTPTSLIRSASSGILHHGSHSTAQFPPIFTEPIIDWSVLRQQDPDGQIDSELVRQFINEQHRFESSHLSTDGQSMPSSTQFYSPVENRPYSTQPYHNVHSLSNDNSVHNVNARI
jgi:hypothetical protein